VCRMEERAWLVPTSSDSMAFGADFLLVGETDCRSFAEGHHCSCVAAAVVVYHVGCINPPADCC
jgi:hypothetical protein